ncbi:MAG: 4Fe-4S binding protein [Treponema sp.]|jgi:epoxyqueuosine reductase QueG|nr:4Fe-4S binding protein [Treponema sp.]
MDKNSFLEALEEYVNTAPGNHVDGKIALRPELAGMRIFDKPLFGFAGAGDPLFGELKKPGVIGGHFLAPGEWLAGARTVVSAFLPFTRTVREANRLSRDWPADEWLHGRIEGQAFAGEFCLYAKSLLEAEGRLCVVPLLDPRFSTKSPVSEDKNDEARFTSNWSERHAAYICGLGTFGLSRGLITSLGVAGRLASLITDWELAPSERAYTGIYDYCSRCGACAKNCPAGAISLEQGKRHVPCSAFLDRVMERHRPRYGCGKCQTAVPCEAGIPKRRSGAGGDSIAGG